MTIAGYIKTKKSLCPKSDIPKNSGDLCTLSLETCYQEFVTVRGQFVCLFPLHVWKSREDYLHLFLWPTFLDF